MQANAFFSGESKFLIEVIFLRMSSSHPRKSEDNSLLLIIFYNLLKKHSALDGLASGTLQNLLARSF